MRFSGPRRPRWGYTLLDETDQPLRALDGVDGGSCEVAATTRLGGTASLKIDERGQGIDWMKHRVQISYDPGIRGVEAWPIATMLFSTPRTTYGEHKTTHTVSLLSKMAVIDEDTMDERFSLAAGAPIISTVIDIIRSTGETRIAATDSTATLVNPRVWDADASKLTIINDLLETAGYWSLWCDGSGQYRVEPYVRPEARPEAYEFATGQYSIHKPDWEREQDLSNVPNRFQIVGAGSDTTPALVALATNENPASPFSHQARGRWITRTETGVEGTQAVLNQLAQRRLIDAMSPVAKIDVNHAIVPLQPNQKISFKTPHRTTHATIQRMAYDLTFNGQCRAEWREA